MLAKVASKAARLASGGARRAPAKTAQEAYNRGHEHGTMTGSIRVMAAGSFGVLGGLILAEWSRQSKR